VVSGAAEAAEPDRFVFRPVADAYVSSSAPTTSYGTSSALWIDSSPQKKAFLRFAVSGIAGRVVTNVRLRLFQADAAPSGGRVFSLSSNSWSETITWDTRPAIDGAQLAQFGAVSNGAWYEVPLGREITEDGVLSLAVDPTSSDSARWASRESRTSPRLVVEVEPVPGLVLDGATEVADPWSGSSSPTYYGSNHRLAVTASGRLLTVHGRHAEGVQLAWRDPGGGWQTDTTGAVADGLLLRGTGTGDWPASIAVGRDSAGEEHAWVIWSASTISSTKPRPVQMRRLSKLDAPGGPSVGPVVTVDAPALGAARPDLAIEPAPEGSGRGVATWVRRTADLAYELVTAWFSDLTTDTPTFHDATTILTTTSSSRTATLEAAPDGTRLIANAGAFRLYRHSASDPLTTWSRGATGTSVSSSVRPSATVLASGETLVAAETDTTSDVVTVQRFAPAGTSTSVALRLAGYAEPTIASDGAGAWLVMVRVSDGSVVSRRFDALLGWSAEDAVEMASEGGPAYSHPNAVRKTDGRLRFVVRGAAGVTGSRYAVRAYQRPVVAP
jgi:hypothetical protein